MKKVLIISYYWPPAGGISVQRCLKFVKYLRDFGWEPIVYAPRNAHYPYYDNENFKDIPENLTILRYPIIEPFKAFKKISGRRDEDGSNPLYARNKKVSFIDNFSIWLRGNFFIPDARCLWIRPSVRFLSKYLKDNPIHAILTNGPPHTNTFIGYKLAKKTGISWLADFQDPWTQVDYYKMFKIQRLADRKHKRMEQKVFRQADKITIVSSSWARDLEKIGAKNVSVVYWGYDEEDFPVEYPELDHDFSIIHAGTLGYDRNPKTLLRVLKDIKAETSEFGKNLKLKFTGVVDFMIKKEINENGLNDNFIDYGVVSRSKAIDMTMKGQILLLPLNIAENAHGRIPGKLFENLRARRPILCLGPKGSDVENIIESTNSGRSFEYDDYIGIKQFIKENYTLFLSSKSKNNRTDISKYLVKNQVKKIAKFLNEII